MVLKLVKLLNNFYLRFCLTFFLFITLTMIVNNSYFFSLDYFNTQWDAIARVLSSVRAVSSGVRILSKDFVFSSTDWLPLHFIVIAGVYKIFSNITAIIYFHFALAALAAALMVEYVSDQKKFSFKHYLINFSFVFTTFQIPFLLFVTFTTHSENLFLLLMMLALFNFKKMKSNWINLGLFLIFSNLMNLVRYEGWLISFVLFLVFIFNSKDKLKKLSLLFLGASPIWWLWNISMIKGSALSLFDTPNTQAMLDPLFGGNSIFTLFLLIYFPFFVCILGIINFSNKMNNFKKIVVENKELFSISLASFVFISYLNASRSLYFDPRYYCIPLVLWVLFTLKFFQALNENEIVIKKFLPFILFLLSFPKLTSTHMIKYYSYVDYEKPGLKQAIDYVGQLDYSNDKYFHFIPFELYSFFFPLISGRLDFSQIRGVYMSILEEDVKTKDFFYNYFMHETFKGGEKLPDYLGVPVKAHFIEIFKSYFEINLKDKYTLDFKNSFLELYKKKRLSSGIK